MAFDKAQKNLTVISKQTLQIFLMQKEFRSVREV